MGKLRVRFIDHELCVLLLLVVIMFGSQVVIPMEFPGEQGEKKSAAMFVLGDSLFDSGNNQYWKWNGSRSSSSNNTRPNMASYYPYGETYFKHPSGRFCDGRLIPDFVALFAKLPLLPPYMKPGKHDFTNGANIASAGAGVLDSTHPTIAINLHTQLSYLKNVERWLKQKLGDVEAKTLMRRAVYLFDIGGNDYFSFFELNTNPTASSQREYVRMVIGNLTNVVKEIYGMGGRKMAFQNVGPLGCVPGAKVLPGLGDKCAEVPMALARRHNRLLSYALRELQSQLPPGFKYSIFDSYNAVYDRINNPSKYGFKEGKAACCGTGAYRALGCGKIINGTIKYELCSNPSEYIFFDSAHTTERANWQLAKLFWNGSPKVTRPYNLKQLFTLT